MTGDMSQCELPRVVIAHPNGRPCIERCELVLPETRDRISLSVGWASVEAEEVDVGQGRRFPRRITVLRPFVCIEKLRSTHTVLRQVGIQVLPKGNRSHRRIWVTVVQVHELRELRSRRKVIHPRGG